MEVARTSVILNRNDLIDQTIGIADTLFDRVVFFYTADRFLPETVDNITFSLVEVPPIAAPEPAHAWLLALGFVLVLMRTLARHGGNRWTQR